MPQIAIVSRPQEGIIKQYVILIIFVQIPTVRSIPYLGQYARAIHQHNPADRYAEIKDLEKDYFRFVEMVYLGAALQCKAHPVVVSSVRFVCPRIREVGTR